MRLFKNLIFRFFIEKFSKKIFKMSPNGPPLTFLIFCNRLDFQKVGRGPPFINFFRQTTELIAYVPLFTETDKFTQAEFNQCKLTAKGPPFVFYLFYITYKTGRLQRVPLSIFFRHCANFFSKIFKVSKESPLRIF